MAKGSQNSWGYDFKLRHCSVCGERVTLKAPGSWSGTRRDGSYFLLCRKDFPSYSRVWNGE